MSGESEARRMSAAARRVLEKVAQEEGKGPAATLEAWKQRAEQVVGHMVVAYHDLGA